MTRQAIYRRPWLYPAQREAIFAPDRYAVVEASTKAGKTVGCIVWLTEQAMAGKAGQNYWWVAPVYPQTKIAFRRLKAALPAELFRANESELTVTLANGAIISFKSGEKADNLYGEDVFAVVIDEATRLREESWHAIRSTLTATRGPCRIIGNVKGRKNWAYQLARKAEAGEQGFHYAKLTAHDAVAAGVLQQAEVEDAKRQLPESVFRELYLAEPSDDDGNPFGVAAIRACIGPLSSEPAKAWGWDLAKSTDWTVGTALDELGRVVALHRFQHSWEVTKREIVRLTPPAPAYVDSTGVGDPVLEGLQAMSPGTFEGWTFTSRSKQQLMEGLAVAIQERAVVIPKEGPLVAELEAFEYHYSRTGVSYSAPPGMHDDCVCSLALALARLRAAPADAWSWIGGYMRDRQTQEAQA